MVSIVYSWAEIYRRSIGYFKINYELCMNLFIFCMKALLKWLTFPYMVYYSSIIKQFNIADERCGRVQELCHRRSKFQKDPWNKSLR